MDKNKLRSSGDDRTNLMIYRVLGMPMLKRVIMKTIGKSVLLVNPREKMPSYFIGQPFKIDSLWLTLKWTYFNEGVHIFLILINAVLGYFFWKKGYNGGVAIMVGSALLNIGLAI